MWSLGVTVVYSRAYRPTGGSIICSLGVILVYSRACIGLLVVQSSVVWVSFLSIVGPG